MKPLAVEQSLPICCGLAMLGGILEVAATAVTAVPAVREKQGITLKWWVSYMALVGNVALQAVGSLMSHLIATWFGPVSLVVPFFYSATLLSNMLIFGLLGERFTKNMRVGTHVIVVAVILLPVVGPDIQEAQDISELMRHWYSIVWFTLLLVACAMTGLLLSLKDIMKYQMSVRMTILLVARAASISVNLTVSRAFILGLNDAVLLTFVIIKLVSGAIYTYAIVVQSYAVEQARFVPLNATMIILVNALTGIIIWEDWRVVKSWYGYICIFVLLGLGCDLLLSVPLLNAENPEFGTGRRASLIIKKKALLEHQPVVAVMTPSYDAISNQQSETKYSYSAPPVAQASRRRARVDAWKELVGPKDEEDQQELVDEEGDQQQPLVEGGRLVSNNQTFMTPQRFCSAAKETTLLLAHQPLHLGEKLAKAATALVQKGGGGAPDSTPSTTQQQQYPHQHLSRRAAWRETVSPIRAHLTSAAASALRFTTTPQHTNDPPPAEHSPSVSQGDD